MYIIIFFGFKIEEAKLFVFTFVNLSNINLTKAITKRETNL